MSCACKKGNYKNNKKATVQIFWTNNKKKQTGKCGNTCNRKTKGAKRKKKTEN